MSKTVLANVDGFTPLIDAVVMDVGIAGAAVFGKMWRYCQMSDGVCKASQDRIAEELGIKRAAVHQHIKRLIEAGYLKDTTPDFLGVPHAYADTGKASMNISISASPVLKTDNIAEPVLKTDTPCINLIQPPVLKTYTKKVLKKELRELKEIPPKQKNLKDLSLSEYRKIPELRIFMDATGWIPGSFVLQTIIDFVSKGLTEKSISDAFRAWTARGYKPGNVEGYLTWARDGIPAFGPRQSQKPVAGYASPGEYKL